MAHVLIREEMVQECTNRQIEAYFAAAGIPVQVIPIFRLFESSVPADSLIATGGFTKIFGLQYKALYDDETWRTDTPSGQHERLRRFPWIWYCLSEMRSLAECPFARDIARFSRPSSTPTPTPLRGPRRYYY